MDTEEVSHTTTPISHLSTSYTKDQSNVTTTTNHDLAPSECNDNKDNPSITADSDDNDAKNYSISSSGNTSSTNEPTRSEEYVVPTFDISEIECGSILGSGATSTVFNVTSITLNKEKNKEKQQQQQQEQQLGKINLANQYNDSNKPQIALKTPKKVLQGHGLKRALMDLQSEIQILTKIQYQYKSHSNIVQFHGMVVEQNGASFYQNMNDEKPTKFEPKYSLLLQKVNTTLPKYISKWQDQRGIGLYEFLNPTSPSIQKLWLERFIIITKLASAIKFLHEHEIIYRDLKPDNVGFVYVTSDGNVVEPVLFDFGLARTLPPSPVVGSCGSTTADTKTTQEDKDGKNKNDTDNNDDDILLYDMSGDTGTKRYMAPEVYQDRPYNLSADIYSLSILMYEILSLRKPYGNLTTSSTFYKEVIVNNKRPVLKGYGWPNGLVKLMTSMWDVKLERRPQCELVVAALESMLRGPDGGLYPRC